eukprot:s3447_g1.t1
MPWSLTSLQRAGTVCARHHWRRCLLLYSDRSPVPALEVVQRSLQDAGISTVPLASPSLSSLSAATPELVDDVAQAALASEAELVLGVGNGAVLDLAKAVAAMAPLVKESRHGSTAPGFSALTARFLLGEEGGHSLLPGASLPLLLAPTHATVATTSGRCLLRRNDAVASLVPMAVAGPGPFGVGVGLQATEILADVSVTSWQSVRGRAAAVAHAMSIFVDAAAAAAGTIKQKQLMDDMMVGVGSSFSALRHPDASAYDALDATLAAGVCASDADANARGELCAIHALAATMVGCREVSFPMACRVLLPAVLRVWAEEEDSEAQKCVAGLSEAMLGPAKSPHHALLALADWLDGALSAASLPSQLPLAPLECPDSAAALLALETLEAPVVQQRPQPGWFEPKCLRQIFRSTLDDGHGKKKVWPSCGGSAIAKASILVPHGFTVTKKLVLVMALITSVLPRPDRPPVLPPSLFKSAAAPVEGRAKRRRSAVEKLLARADQQVAKSRRSSPPAAPEWPQMALLGQQLFSKFLEYQMPSDVLGADAARRLAAYAASTLRLAWATGIANESASDWQRTLEESLQEALSVLALDFADPDLHRRPKAALRGLLQHLQSLDQLLLGLWAIDPELPHPWKLSEASCRYHLQKEDIADGVRQLFKQSDLTRRVALRWGVRKAWLKSGKGSPWSKVASDSAPCDALRMLRARWLEAVCLARSAPSSPQTLKAISTWLLVGRDITARWHAFAIPSSKILKLGLDLADALYASGQTKMAVEIDGY